MAEQEQRSAHDLAKATLSATREQVESGQQRGFQVVMAALIVAAALGWLGHGWAAGMVGTTTVVGLATVFVLGRRSASRGKEADSPQGSLRSGDPETSSDTGARRYGER